MRPCPPSTGTPPVGASRPRRPGARLFPTSPPAPAHAQMILMQHKQRHHLITQYIHNPAKDRVAKPATMSPFLEAFYKSN